MYSFHKVDLKHHTYLTVNVYMVICLYIAVSLMETARVEPRVGSGAYNRPTPSPGRMS